MAVPHFSVSIVTRGAGRSAVLSAAYRHRAKMEFQREARQVDYSARRDLLHEEFAIPGDAPDWLKKMIKDRSVAQASEAFWNRVEDAERRSDAQLAKDVTIALPLELSPAQNIALMQDFIATHVTAQGMVADWVFHNVAGNPHVHLMTTLRPLDDKGFGPKKVAILKEDGSALRNEAGKIVYRLWAGGPDDFARFRDGWFAVQNRHLALAGLDLKVDGSSFAKQKIDLEPTIHLGVSTRAIERKAMRKDQQKEAQRLERLALQEEYRRENARRIIANPDIVLDKITREKSVFDRQDIARLLHRYIDDAALFQNVMARVLQSPQCLRLEGERIDFVSGRRQEARYTTRQLIRLEAEMVNRSIWLSKRSSHALDQRILETILERHQHLSGEQQAAIAHVTGPEHIAALVGRAGAGKTTMMKAAREAWGAAGYRVIGGALAGKAAEGLEKEAGIPSRTLSSFELSWEKGRDRLDKHSVFVLDEAGMVSSRQMALLVDAVTRAGAKLVLVGDPDQLQPIEAGAAFRAIADRIGYGELETIYRQQEQWMCDASLAFARGQVDKALEAYQAKGKVRASALKSAAVSNLIEDWTSSYDPEKSSLILAHLRRDVRQLNALARGKLVDLGVLDEGSPFKTADGDRHFARGDQIVFLRNEGSLGVKNGMLAKVVDTSAGQVTARLGERGQGSQVVIEQRFYNNLDYGYATTIHKAQGATVDRVKVLASLSLDRHLTYVAMTRHRDDCTMYFGELSFARAGGLIRILSRRNAKETTLDYEAGSFYRSALQFAEARGLHIWRVARVMARDRLDWTLRQRQKVLDLAERLARFASTFGLSFAPTHASAPKQGKAAAMVAGITTHARTVDDIVEDRLTKDRGLSRLWEEVSMRFHHVYGDPETAFKAVHVEAMLENQSMARQVMAQIASQPHRFGILKGSGGLLASGKQKAERERALRNAQPLADSLHRYLERRRELVLRIRDEELASRNTMAIAVPSLSARAQTVVEAMRRAIDCQEIAAALAQGLADKTVQDEIEAFSRAVSARFGKGTFLPLSAKDAEGQAFHTVTAGMTDAAKQEIRQAWSTLRTVQQFTVYAQSVTAPKQSEVMRQTQTSGMSLK